MLIEIVNKFKDSNQKSFLSSLWPKSFCYGNGNSHGHSGSSAAFTQVELLITVTIIIILASGVVLAINPLRQFAEARDQQREVHLNAVLSAVEEKKLSDNGWKNCPDLPTEDYKPIGRGEGMYDLYSCIYPEYLSEVVVDPEEGSKSGDRAGIEDGYYWSFNGSLSSDDKGIDPVDDSIATLRVAGSQNGSKVVAVEKSTTNLLPNPLLKDEDNDNLPDDWSMDSNFNYQDNASVEYNAEEGFIVWRGNSGTDIDVSISHIVTEITEGADYTLSFYTKHNFSWNDGDSYASCRIQWEDGSGTDLGSTQIPIQDINKEWHKINFTGTAPVGATQAKVVVGTSSNLENKEYLGIKKPQFEQKEFSTSFVDDSREEGYLSYRYPSWFDLEGEFTVAGWFKLPHGSTGDWRDNYLIELGSNSDRSKRFDISWNDADDGMRMNLADESWNYFGDNGGLPGVWYFVVVTNQGKTSKAYFFDQYGDMYSKEYTRSADLSSDYFWIAQGASDNLWTTSLLIDNLTILPYKATDEQIQKWYNFQYNSKYSIWKNPVSDKISLKATNDEINQVSAGAPSGALSFDGDDDFINIQHDDVFDLTNQFTVSAWIKLDQYKDWQGIITSGVSPGEYALQMDEFDGKSLYLTSDYTNNEHVRGDTDLLLDRWYHVGATYDNGEVKLFVGGELDASETVSWSISAFEEPLTIGVDKPGGDEYFDGKISDVRIYNRSLSENEMNNLYHDENITGGLVGYWPLNRMERCEAVDLSGYGNHGTLEPDCANENGPGWTTGR